MKILMVSILAFAALPASALLAQDLTGTWQGTLQAGRELRIVFKISKDEAGGALKAMMHSIDQGGQGIGATVTQQGPTVKMTIAGIGGKYEGKMNAEANSIDGTWTQADSPLPLNLQRATPETTWTIPDPPPTLAPMAKDANPVFEVATIKPSKPEAKGKGITVRGRRFITINTSISDLITFAYGLHARQLSGAPAWFESEKYDIEAQPDIAGQPNEKQLKSMLQKLLTERFQFAFHREKKSLSVYAIVLGKTGSKLTKSEADPDGLPGLGFRGLGLLTVRNASMADFAGVMQTMVLDRPVVDQTALPAKYDFTLDWTPDEFQFTSFGPRPPRPADAIDSRPDLFTAIQEQLGLKLESTKAPVEVFVVDKVEKPSSN